MTLTYKLKFARAVTNVLNRSLDLPVEQIVSRIRVNPFYMDGFSFLIAQEKHMNDPTPAELSALQKELNAKVQLKYAFRVPYTQIVVDQDQFIYDVLTANLKNVFSYRKPIKCLVEFSSPNIAKPFHFGHMRSTIIGNFIANINSFAGNEVIRMNYLGDWGLQFGFLKAGLEMCNFSHEEISANPIKKLHEAYIAANLKSEGDPSIEERSKIIFRDLECASADSPEIQEWHKFRQYTMVELQRIYERLGISFDVYSWESDYSAKRIKPLIEELKEKGVVVPENDLSLITWIGDHPLPFIKSDGTTLYISRDVAAAVDRYERFHFDKMYYVVDSMQRGHFVALIRILEKMGSECASKIEYIPFGRIKGMSSRKGEAVWLDDILNEAQKKMDAKQLQSINRKVPIGGDTAEILGLSALVVSDLKKNRCRQYDFSWESALQADGYSGVKIQYCHCRLHSLKENCGETVPSDCDPKAFPEPVARTLINQIAKFDDALVDSFDKHESCFLVSYLFELCDHTNTAFKVLRVKGEDSHIASQRLLMFMKAKEILNIGMKILGMKPLDQM